MFVRLRRTGATPSRERRHIELDDHSMDELLPISGRDAADRMAITEEMVRAGRAVLYRSGRLQYDAPGPDNLLIKSIFRAMIRVLAGRLQRPLGRRPNG